MPERHQDWLRQARDDLDHARLSARQAHLEWAAFAAQQAAEKACKALHLSLGSDPHPDLVDRAKGLDRHYLPSRYPTGFAQGTPRDHYTLREAEQAIADAAAVIEFCARSIPR